MRTTKLLWISGLGLIGLATCKRNSGQSIEGSYATAFQNEYSKANDTLIITAYDKEANTYQIRRRSGFNRIRKGKVLAREFKQEYWMATYTPETQVLDIATLGRKIYFNPDMGEAVMGRTIYTLIH